MLFGSRPAAATARRMSATAFFSTVFDGVATKATGSVKLQQDGRHRFVYRNAGTAANDGAHVRIAVAPPKLVKRTGYVAPAGTALVPVVTKVTPPSAFHRETAIPVTITGRDFQTGADVRL